MNVYMGKYLCPPCPLYWNMPPLVLNKTLCPSKRPFLEKLLPPPLYLGGRTLWLRIYPSRVNGSSMQIGPLWNFKNFKRKILGSQRKLVPKSISVRRIQKSWSRVLKIFTRKWKRRKRRKNEKYSDRMKCSQYAYWTPWRMNEHEYVTQRNFKNN